ncbi:MAG: hypothetical protein JJU11_10025 [Candidatus Sumerlaeia bacterium]|nr:hypothetical protein [Candidatus Sumerlaeia bacterium]
MNDSFQTFRDLLRQGDNPGFLFETALQVSLLVDEPTNPAWRENARDAVRGYGRRFGESADSLHTESELAQLEKFCRYFSTDLGFRGDTDSYHDPANSSILHVLANRSGLPITLAIVLIEAARHAGLSMWGVAAPRHFVVGTRADGREWVVDPFNHCRIVSVEEYMAEISGGLNLNPDLLLPIFNAAPPRLIIKRMLKNLMVSFSQEGRASQIFDTLEWALELDPDDAEDLLNRGILRLRMRRFGDGAKDLLRVLELTPETDSNRDHIHREAIEALRQSKNNP